MKLLNSAKVYIVALGVIFSILLLLNERQVFVLSPVTKFEHLLLDFKFRLRGVKPAWNDQVIIGIDEKSLSRLGRLPWERRVWVEFFEKLKGLQPKGVGLDVIFSDPDSGSAAVQKVMTDLKSRYRETHPAANRKFSDYLNQTAFNLDVDKRLAEALAGMPRIVGGFYNIWNPEEARHLALPEEDIYKLLASSEFQAVIFEKEIEQTLPQSEAIRTYMPLIAEAMPRQGFMDLQSDEDGSMRRAVLVAQKGLHFYPSLPLQLASVVRSEDLLLKFSTDGVQYIQLGKDKLPVDRYGRLQINFFKSLPSYPILSFYDVLKGNPDKSQIKDKVVWIGATAPIIASEMYATPFSPFTSGVELHATVADNIINKTYLNRVKYAWFLELLLILTLATLYLFAHSRMNPLWGMLSTTVLLVGMFSFDTVFLFSKNIYFHDSIPLLYVASTYIIISAFRFFVEEREDRYVRNAFRHYVSPAVADKIMAAPKELALGGEKKVLTVLFSDIRGFTPLSETLPPDKLTHFLNDYMTTMTASVFKHNGLLDKYMGDALLAIFGAPVSDENHPIHACEAAYEMIQQLPSIREKWPVNHINCGVGVHTGEMIVGNMGSKDVFDYTVVGDNVNLGARLEKSNKIYGTNIIISEDTYKIVKDKISCRELDLIRLRGKSVPARIYELLSINKVNSEEDLSDRFKIALSFYREQRWDEAIKAFKNCLQIKPNDKPSELFIKRSEAFKKSPPKSDWNGVYQAG